VLDAVVTFDPPVGGASWPGHARKLDVPMFLDQDRSKAVLQDVITGRQAVRSSY
jgi:hypothetical protein